MNVGAAKTGPPPPPRAGGPSTPPHALPRRRWMASGSFLSVMLLAVASAAPSAPPGSLGSRCRLLQQASARGGGMHHRPRHVAMLMRLRGGGDSSEPEEPEWIEEEGMYKLGDFLFHTHVDAKRLTGEHFFAKEPGSMLWPLNWPKQVKSLLAGSPQRTTCMQRLNKEEGENGPLVMIDGADDLASALQGSGLPQRLQFALQAFVLYPLVLPVVELGFKGAEGDREECRAAADEARESVAELKVEIASRMAGVVAQCCGVGEGEAQEMVLSPAGREMLLKKVTSGGAVEAPDGEGGSSKGEEGFRTVAVKQRESQVGGGKEGGEREKAMWRQHYEDEKFIADVKQLVRVLGEKGQAGTAGLEEGVRMLSELETVVNKAWEPRVRAALTSPCAMIGTAGMWWAMLGHELAALCNFIGGRNAARVAFVATQLSEIGLPVAQLSMALYGMSVGVNGLFEASHYRKLLGDLRKSRVLGVCDQPRGSVVLQAEALALSNILANVISGPVLAVGQVCMALGGPALLGNLACLLTGGSLTLLSIGFKAFMDIRENRRFGFDDNALPVREELLKDLPPHGSGFERMAVEMLQCRRKMQLHQLAWIKVLKAVNEECSRSPSIFSSCFGKEESVESRLVKRLRNSYQRGYQSELKGVLATILDSEKAWAAVKCILSDGQDRMMMTFVTLKVVRAIEQQTWNPVQKQEHVRDCEHVRMEDNARTNNLASEIWEMLKDWREMDRKMQAEAVLVLLERDNLTQYMHQSVLTQMIVEGPWCMRPEPKHAPFLEVVDIKEERSLGVPFLTVGAYNHKKRAYRFLEKSFLSHLDRAHRTAAHTNPPSSQSWFQIARSVSTAGDKESAMSFLADVELMVQKGAWFCVCLHRKYRARSELGCLNDALIAMVRQRELKRELKVSVPHDQ
mmetsp:Transcript_38820/g.99182  ORF Transcript_38820/g.99182 Transcript_38820/m.99182 type:complete len:910 (-) Transcript_38820:85-2814(-)